MSKHAISTVVVLILVGLIVGCAAKKKSAVSPQAPVSTTVTRNWAPAPTPFPAVNITAVGNVFWVCGADEMIASSSDGGATWTIEHQNRGGGVLLNIAFTSDKVGHAAGTHGLLLSTMDGGKTWQEHHASDTVWKFSFADARNGIAVIGGRRSVDPVVWWDSSTLSGTVRLTHDGGDHWEDITALDSEELRPFTLVLAVAALDPSHYLMIRRQPEVEDIYVVTSDGGTSWKVVRQRNDATNRELADWIFPHDGEYWAFGMELVHREKGGGYGVPLAMHSRDGQIWTHGVNGEHEFGSCNPQGCYMWDGTVEALYGEHEQYWALPQDCSMTFTWAIAGARACTIHRGGAHGSTRCSPTASSQPGPVECGPATTTEQPQPRPEAN